MSRSRRPARRKDDAEQGSRSDDPRAIAAGLLAVLNHPIRQELLKHYVESDRALSPKELADLTGAKLPTVSYHVRVLADERAIELIEEEPVRGSVAHFYRASDLTRKTPWVLESLGVRLSGA
jgi:DNA-binding transcriptional ArsR family regulator